MLKKLRNVLLTVLPTVMYARLDYDNEQNAKPPFIVYQEISKRAPIYGDDRPRYYLRTIQITLITKNKDEVLEEKLEKALLDNDYIFSLTSEFENSDHSINRVYEIRLEDYKYAK
ncbi:MAG: hypothetical protein LKE36_02215 [Bacilli bacterium]|jgi:hypothetical protein|nr:hypothetical protein [Bacilli bacterium]